VILPGILPANLFFSHKDIIYLRPGKNDIIPFAVDRIFYAFPFPNFEDTNNNFELLIPTLFSRKRFFQHTIVVKYYYKGTIIRKTV